MSTPENSGAETPASTSRHPSQRELTAQEKAALAKAERGADVIRGAGFAAIMASAVPFGEGVGSTAYKVFLDRLIKECGNPDDPILTMMIEQFVLAHFRVGQLHLQVERAQSIEAAKIYSAAAARLTGEVRRLGLAIRQYRQPVSTKHFTVVKQQNLAGGDQQVAYIDQSTATSSQDEVPLIDGGGKQGSKRLAHAPKDEFLAESQAGGCRTPEPQEARPADRRGPGTAEAGCTGDKTLAALDRPANSRGEGPVGR